MKPVLINSMPSKRHLRPPFSHLPLQISSPEILRKPPHSQGLILVPTSRIRQDRLILASSMKTTSSTTQVSTEITQAKWLPWTGEMTVAILSAGNHLLRIPVHRKLAESGSIRVNERRLAESSQSKRALFLTIEKSL